MSVIQYVGLSAQIALQHRLDMIAANVANQSTAGYRAEGIRFESVLSRTTGTPPIAYTSAGETYILRAAGPVVDTGNPLDIAVKGDVWLAIRTPVGTVYTRDGRMKIRQTGQLVTLNGYPVLDAGGAPIILDPLGGSPQIAHDGMITQDGVQVGAVGLFRIGERAKLARYANSGVIPDRAAEPVLDFTEVGVVQGFIEGANVDPVRALTDLITVSRRFDSLAAALGQHQSSLRKAIDTLGTA